MFIIILFFLTRSMKIFYFVNFDKLLYLVIFWKHRTFFLAFFSENDITLYSAINMLSEAINTKLRDNGILVRVVLYGHKHIMCFEL